MPPPSHNESDLVRRAVTGDGEAFGMLYQMHLDAIYRYVYFRVSDVSDAEDLTEQTFLKAWEALSGYVQGNTRFVSWLYRIAQNLIIDHYRRQKAVSVPLDDQRGDWECSQQSTALERVIDAEESVALASAIARLPEEQQQVIVLRFIEGLNHAEVARILSKSEGACRVIQHRALAALSQLLDGVGG